MKKAKKEFELHLCKGGDCTAKSQMFIYEGAVKKVIDNYIIEQFNKAIGKVMNLKINGVRGLVSRADVVNVLQKLKKEKF